MQAYPEFCRQVFDAAPQGFQIAVAELQDRHGKVRACICDGPSTRQRTPRLRCCAELVGQRLACACAAAGVPKLVEGCVCIAGWQPPKSRPFLSPFCVAQAAQRKYVLLALWMARHGGGIVPGKAIVDSARRVRVRCAVTNWQGGRRSGRGPAAACSLCLPCCMRTRAPNLLLPDLAHVFKSPWACSSDLEFEMDRFSEALNEINSKYTYMERPRGSLAQQARRGAAGCAGARQTALGWMGGRAAREVVRVVQARKALGGMQRPWLPCFLPFRRAP